MPYKTDLIQRTFSFHEILANSVTHAIGVGLSIAALVILIINAVKHGDAWHLAGFIVFGIS